MNVNEKKEQDLNSFKCKSQVIVQLFPGIVRSPGVLQVQATWGRMEESKCWQQKQAEEIGRNMAWRRAVYWANGETHSRHAKREKFIEKLHTVHASLSKPLKSDYEIMLILLCPPRIAKSRRFINKQDKLQDCITYWIVLTNYGIRIQGRKSAFLNKKNDETFLCKILSCQQKL